MNREEVALSILNSLISNYSQNYLSFKENQKRLVDLSFSMADMFLAINAGEFKNQRPSMFDNNTKTGSSSGNLLGKA